MPSLSSQRHIETLTCTFMHTYCRGKCGIPLADFFPLSGIFFKEKRSSCRGLSTCLHSTPAISAPTLLLLLPSPLFPHSFTGSVLDFSPSPGPGAPAATPPPPSRLCVWGRMEKGGSVQQANQAFCLWLCVCGGGEGTLHSGSGAAAAGAEKEEGESERTGGGGVDVDRGRWGNKRKKRKRAGPDSDICTASQALLQCYHVMDKEMIRSSDFCKLFL